MGKKKGQCRFSCKDLKLGKADRPALILGKRAPDDGDGSNREDSNVAAGAGGGNGGGGSSNRELWLKDAAAELEKQGTCSFAELQSYEQLSWSVVEAEVALVAV